MDTITTDYHHCVVFDKDLIFCEMLREALQNRQYYATFCYPFDIIKMTDFINPRQSTYIIGPHFSSEEQMQVIDSISHEACQSLVLIARSQEVVNHAQQALVRLQGLLGNTVSMSELFFCLQELRDERPYVSPRLAELPSSPVRQFKADEVRAKTALAQTLTKREKEILFNVSLARSTNQIAETLFISPVTVNNHKANIREKLGVKGEHRLLYYALMLKPMLSQHANVYA